MRASIYKDDPGYPTLMRLRPLKVFLDGVECSDVVTADEEEGFLLRYKAGKDFGRFVLNESRVGLETEYLRGEVRIKEVG